MVGMQAKHRFLLFGLLASAGFAQGLEYVKAHYTKYEFQIPMRDGKRLFTSVYVPKDASAKYPIMLDRTPPIREIRARGR
jgi:predicted acyl esterase